MISGSVAPLARFVIAMTSAFLFARSALGLLTAFLARPAFADFGFLLALRAAASAAGVLVFSDSMSLISP